MTETPINTTNLREVTPDELRGVEGGGFLADGIRKLVDALFGSSGSRVTQREEATLEIPNSPD